MQRINLKDLHNMNMIANIDPLPDFLLQHLLLLFGSYFLETIRTENGVLLFEDQVCRWVEFIKWGFVYNGAFSFWSLTMNKNYTEVLLVVFFFLGLLLKLSCSSSY